MNYALFLLSLMIYSACEACTVFWFTGLPCSGKTTIAEKICQEHPEFLHLDGDVLRKTLTADLGFSLEDRAKNLERIARYALSKKDETPAILVTTISPLSAHRQAVMEIFQEEGVPFFMVYIDTPLNTCIQRDVKGMYAKALCGEIKSFTGISSPYEPPKAPDLVFKTEEQPVETITKQFLSFYETASKVNCEPAHAPSSGR